MEQQTIKSKRKVSKILSGFRLLFMICIVLLTALCVFHLNDENLTVEAETFFTPTDINENENFYIAWTGLHAPSGESDLQSFGQGVFDGTIRLRDVQLLRYNDDSVPYKRYCVKQDKHEQYNPPYENTPCYTPDEISLLLEENHEILSRLESLHSETNRLNVNLGGLTEVGFIYWQDVISMQGLLCRKWMGQSENGEAKQAIESWIVSIRAIKHIIRGQLSFVDQMAWHRIYKRSLDCLPVILGADTALIKSYGDQLIDILSFNYLEQWNIKQMLQADGSFLNEFETSDIFILALLYQPNSARNKLYNASIDIMDLSREMPSKINREAAKLENKYGCSVYQPQNCLLFNLILNKWFFNFQGYGQVFENSARLTVQQRATVLWIKAHMQDIPQDEILDFLQNTSPDLFDPLTDEPFNWDKERHSIYHEVPVEGGKYKQKDLIYFN